MRGSQLVGPTVYPRRIGKFGRYQNSTGRTRNLRHQAFQRVNMYQIASTRTTHLAIPPRRYYIFFRLKNCRKRKAPGRSRGFVVLGVLVDINTQIMGEVEMAPYVADLHSDFSGRRRGETVFVSLAALAAWVKQRQVNRRPTRGIAFLVYVRQ